MLCKDEINEVINVLFDMYPGAKCELNYRNPFELLIATVLSAQTTDKKVNELTEELFDKYKTPEDFLNLTTEELGLKIKKIGLYRTKSNHILSLCRSLVDNFNGSVPHTKKELMTLDGVGRKTANVVLANAFNIPTMAVDTHVFRVSNRIGFADGKDVLETEKDLMENVPKDKWIRTHHTLISHGRALCIARNPKCSLCAVKKHCCFYKNKISKD